LACPGADRLVVWSAGGSAEDPRVCPDRVDPGRACAVYACLPRLIPGSLNGNHRRRRPARPVERRIPQLLVAAAALPGSARSFPGKIIPGHCNSNTVIPGPVIVLLFPSSGTTIADAVAVRLGSSTPMGRLLRTLRLIRRVSPETDSCREWYGDLEVDEDLSLPCWRIPDRQSPPACRRPAYGHVLRPGAKESSVAPNIWTFNRKSTGYESL
jgi:hypothetical protein